MHDQQNENQNLPRGDDSQRNVLAEINYMKDFNRAIQAINKDKDKDRSKSKRLHNYRLAHFRRDAPKIVRLFCPVLACVLFVLFSVIYLDYYAVPVTSLDGKGFLPHDNLEVEPPPHRILRSHRLHEKTFQVPSKPPKSDIFSHMWVILVALAGLFLFLIAGTFCLLILYKRGYSRSVTLVSIIPYVLYLAIFPLVYIQEFTYTFNIAIDWFTVLLFLYNQTVVGLLVLFYAGPNWAKKIYVVFIGAMLALFLIKFMNEWVEVGLMVLLICWDLFAMLHSSGKFIHSCIGTE